MTNDNMIFLKDFVAVEDIESYQSIVDENSELYAEYVAEGLIFSLKKSLPQFRKDKINIIMNRLIYKFNCLLSSDRKDTCFDKCFDMSLSFIQDFKILLTEIEILLSNESSSSEVVADIYLCYLALANIYISFFSRFNDCLKQKELQARRIASLPKSNKTLEENIGDFERVQTLIRELKQN